MSAAPVPPRELPHLVVSAVTVWDGRVGRRTELLGEAPGPAWRNALESADRRSVVWLEMGLDADPRAWINPWDPPMFAPGWSAFEQVADLLGLRSPQTDPEALAPLKVVLDRLPRINELGELQWLEAEIEHDRASVLALPLTGFRPTVTLPSCRDGDLLELLLLRVNLAVWDRYVLTVRLPDRLCSGAPSEDGGRRIPAPRSCSEGTPTAEPERYLAPGDRPSAVEIGKAIALYLSATCGCVAEYARRELTEVENRVLRLLRVGASENGGPESEGPEGADSEDPEGTHRLEILTAQYLRIFGTRGALQMAEEELARLLQRQFEVAIPEEEDDFRYITRRRYERALEDVRTAESELRLAGDALTHRLETWQLEQSTRQEQLAKQREKDAVARSESIQRLVAVLGTLLVAPTLIASVFQDQYKIPHPKSAPALIGMLLLMVGTVGVVLLVFMVSQPSTPRDVSLLRRLGSVPGGWLAALAALGTLVTLVLGFGLVVSAH
jgi:hypothetical protein